MRGGDRVYEAFDTKTRSLVALKAVEAEVTQLKHEAEDSLAKAQAAAEKGVIFLDAPVTNNGSFDLLSLGDGGMALSRTLPSACPRLTSVNFPASTCSTIPTAAPSVDPGGVVASSDAGCGDRASKETAAAQGIVAVMFCGW